MIACLYGRDCAPFVEPVLHDLCAAAAAAGGVIQPLTVEAALADRQRGAEVHRLYVLPFDPPSAPGRTPAAPEELVRALFPKAALVTSFAVQDLCWDKIATQERLLGRGIPVPETLITSEPADVHEFVRHHGFAILKERFACGGHGHLVVWFDGGRLVGDGGSHQRAVELTHAGERRLWGDRLVYPGPFYVQRLIADVGPRGVTPGQVLRAYVVDNQIPFWTERYRDRYTRPADWIINVGRGAKYRFVLSASEEAKKLALRSAEVLGLRIGAVDLIRTGSTGPYVLELDTDGRHMLIDRQFKSIPDYRDFFDLDRYIAEALVVEPEPLPARRTPAG
jgi:RimK-like ATP-grasp domain